MISVLRAYHISADPLQRVGIYRPTNVSSSGQPFRFLAPLTISAAYINVNPLCWKVILSVLSDVRNHVYTHIHIDILELCDIQILWDLLMRIQKNVLESKSRQLLRRIEQCQDYHFSFCTWSIPLMPLHDLP